jgi:hypothetical protein
MAGGLARVNDNEREESTIIRSQAIGDGIQV